jgi:hypothetical protein
MKKSVLGALVLLIGGAFVGYGYSPLHSNNGIELAQNTVSDRVPDVILAPACYLEGEPEYMSDKCPKPKIEPAYQSLRGVDVLPQKQVEVLSPPVNQPSPPFVDPYPNARVQPSGGMSIVNKTGDGNYSVTAPDGGLTLINRSGGTTIITPADNRPMTICSGSSCFSN